ncbi:MAG: FtsQ-type POTRA domain-containing protein [Firmicutes bacterium]|nr:FtsQ-type POTRA domain-containing protein [Bacillota bacterium]
MLLGMTAAAAAQAPAARLDRVSIQGTAHYTSEQVLQAAGLTLGQSVTSKDLQEAADRLAQLGLFREVRYRFTSVGEAIHLEWQLVEAPTLPLLFDNVPWLTDEELLAAIRAQLPLFNGTAPEGGTMLEQIQRILEQELARVGISARVEVEVMPRITEDGMLLRFRVLGPVLNVGEILWGHSLAAEAPRLREFRGDIVGRPFSRYRLLLFARDHVLPLYLAAGHLQVSIGTPQARFAGDPNRPLPEQVVAIVPIEPGPVYQLGEVTWSGNAVLGTPELNHLLDTPTGQVADGMRLRAGWERIRDEYARRGYLDAVVHPEPSFDARTQTVRYQVHITEGPQYRFAQLVLTGLSVRAEQLVQQAWKLRSGDVLDRIYFDTFLETLRTRRQQIFGNYVVHYQHVGSYLRKNESAHTVDVLIDFK